MCRIRRRRLRSFWEIEGGNGREKGEKGEKRERSGSIEGKGSLTARFDVFYRSLFVLY